MATRRWASASCARAEAPIRQIADNAGAHGEVIVEQVKTSPRGHGFDALKGEYGGMFKKGIVNATKVIRPALQNSASIAAMVLTTETLITDLPEKKQSVPAGAGGYGGEMDYGPTPVKDGGRALR